MTLWLPKPEPFTVNATASESADTDRGAKPVIIGEAFNTLSVKEAAPPPGAGFVTTPLRTPGERSKAAETLNDTESWETDAGIAVPLMDTAVELMNPWPLIVTEVVGEPTTTEDGDSSEIHGAGLRRSVITNAIAPVVPPCGAGFVTVMPTLRARLNAAPGMRTVINCGATVSGEYGTPSK
jgi:hypothetical protein